MNKVYVILYDGKVSQEGYSNYDDAMKYCEERGKRYNGLCWAWADDKGKYYKIIEIKIV